MDKPLFPQVTLDLASLDGNVFALIGAASKAARRAKVANEDISKFQTEAMSGDYDHVIQTIMRYFDCSGSDED